jgi:hypothetical protein
MKKHHSIFAIEKMCKVLKVSKSGYYHWLSRKLSIRQVDGQQALELIKEIYQARVDMAAQKLLMNLRKKVFLYLGREWLEL